ncbi:M23 family metallopeptidase [Vibrio algicola]|nr:M23 family metallopeptidase [Vibrio algicola]
MELTLPLNNKNRTIAINPILGMSAILLIFGCVFFSLSSLIGSFFTSLPPKTAGITINYLHQKSQQYKDLYNDQLLINQNLQSDLALLDEESPQLDDEEGVEIVVTNTNQAISSLLLSFSQSNPDDTIPDLSPAVKATLFRMIPNDSPMSYTRVSSPYGTRVHPITGKSKRHLGIDLTCPSGGSIYSTADGVVELTRPSNQGYGNLIKIRHGFGFISMYAHLHRFLVKTGQFVEKGDPIALCGSTGLSTGPHLHYEIRFLGQTLDPKDFMQWQPENFDRLFKQQKIVHWAALVKNINGLVQLQSLLERTTKHRTINKKSVEKSTSKTKPPTLHRQKELQDFGIDESGWENVTSNKHNTDNLTAVR